MAAETRARWVFGYGSLMWNPGFAYQRAVPARLDGYARRLCVYSFHYRGQPDKPGLVFGLDRGGYCLGLAYEVSEADWPQTYAYLQRRELITMVYKELELPVTLVGDDEAVPALAYVVDRDHPQCACGLTDPQVTALVHQGQGEAGGNLDYVRNTHRHLQSMGFTDPALERIISLLGGDAT